MIKYSSILFLFLFACQQKKTDSPYPFFEFDEITHYKIEMPAKQFIDLISGKDSTHDRELTRLIVNNPWPDSLTDSDFIPALEKSALSKAQVSESKFEVIGNIHSEKYFADEYPSTKCEPFYRDILVFRKNKAITGISKICFGCRKHYIIGSKRDTQQFGQNGDYKKLEQILAK